MQPLILIVDDERSNRSEVLWMLGLNQLFTIRRENALVAFSNSRKWAQKTADLYIF